MLDCNDSKDTVQLFEQGFNETSKSLSCLTSSPDALLEEVITLAKKTLDNRNKAQFKEYKLYSPSSFPSHKDAIYSDWDANVIPGTKLVAAAAPHNPKKVAQFLHSTVFNATMPINDIIVLAGVLEPPGSINRSFAETNDYFTGEDSLSTFSYGKRTLHHGHSLFEPRYHVMVSADKISGIIDRSSMRSEDRRIPLNIVESRLEVSLYAGSDRKCAAPHAKKEVNVTLFKLRERASLKYAANNKQELLWQLFIKSLEKPTLIQCQDGLGRAAHLILIFELLAHYQSIFSSHHVEEIVQGIFQVLDRIQRTRPAIALELWCAEVQFTDAIKCASMLYVYALKMHYIESGKPVYESALQLKNTHTTNMEISTVVESEKETRTLASMNM